LLLPINDRRRSVGLLWGVTMKAKIEKQVSNARNYGNEKETVSNFIVIGKINGEMREVVNARCYMGRSRSASTVYASIWVHGNGIYTSGKGTAGGYGYHKESAAVGDAIMNAGVTLWGSPYTGETGDLKHRAHIGGCGSGSIRAALEAIAKAAGARGKLIWVSC